MQRDSQGLIRRLLVKAGLAYAPGDEPGPGAPRRSRYGPVTSPRLDEDVDALTARIVALEEQLRDARP